jgi:hypothetical protein
MPGPLKRAEKWLEQKNGLLGHHMPQVVLLAQAVFPWTYQMQIGQATFAIQVQVTVFLRENCWWLR